MLTVLPTAIIIQWNLPRTKKPATGRFFASLRSAVLFDSVGIDKKKIPTLLTIPIHAPPGQADNSYLLTKINGNCCSNTRPPAVIKSDIQFQQKEDAARKGCILYQLLGSVLVHFQQDLE